MNEIIKVEGLSKAYHGKQVLKDFHMIIEKGKVFGILGANGAGKSNFVAYFNNICYNLTNEG